MRRLIGQRGQACGRSEVAAPECARDVMTDDLQEQCMSRTRMSCHFIILSQCTTCTITCITHCRWSAFFLDSLVLLHSLARPDPALQFSSSPVFHPVTPSFFTCTTQRASVLHLGALSAVYLLIAAWLFTGSPQQLLPHPHLSCSSLLHQHPPSPVTALHQGIDTSVLAAIYSDTPPPRHCTPLVPPHPRTFLHPTHPQDGFLGDRWRCRYFPRC